MLLSDNEKKLLLKLLKKENKKAFFTGGKDESIDQLIEKIEQSRRNEKTNDTKPNKL
jgi:UDP-N-acetyl-D-mannosaminuronic acid transferase (WecB/TagA/CpsF family)